MPPVKVEVPLPDTASSPVVVTPSVVRNSPTTVDDAFAMKPEPSVARLPTDRVELAERCPSTVSTPPILDDAVATNPPSKDARPETARVELASSAPEAPIVKSGAFADDTALKMSPVWPLVV